MKSTDLQKWQIARIQESVAKGMKYLSKLRGRMDQTFLPADDLFVKVRAAHDAMHDLCVELHYLSCSRGVGRSERK